MSTNDQSGFTLIEVMVAIIVLVIGVSALVGTSALVTRDIGRSKMVTLANEVMTRRLEALKLAAQPNGAFAACAAPGFTSGTAPAWRGITETWTVAAGASPNERVATVTVSYMTPRGVEALSQQTWIGCY
ncbi:MAG TPA: type II secretion system protein [Gemmatimonadales bacterium]|nr:type II secretion system protein [Gemmatimonadales bacterium]